MPPRSNTPPAWFLVHPNGIVVVPGDNGPRLPTEDEVCALGVRGEADAVEGLHEIGDVGGARAVAAAVDELPPAGPFAVISLREVFVAFSEEVFGIAGRATQIVEWARTHRFCGRCATPTERVTGERCMRCPRCGLLAYPRITPAIIVLVRRGDEALLARGARFPLPFYSTLAGFAEVGETLEETLAREVREEVGIEVKNIRYFGSQPWPFPNSLMVGFFAEWAGGEIAIDPKEIVEAHWYRADALPTVPPKISIARRLIDAWLADVGHAGGPT